MSAQAPRHVILENTICGNAGDGAIMLAAEKIIHEACGDDVNILVFDHDARNSKEIYPEQKFRQALSPRLFQTNLGAKRSVRILNRLKNMASNIGLWFGKRGMWACAALFLGRELAKDVKAYKDAEMVVTTGGTYLVENYNMKERIKGFETDIYLGNPPLLFTQSLGPFTKEENRKGLKPIFEKSPLILLRDEQSKMYVDQMIGVTGKSHVVADSVFALAEAERIQSLITQQHGHIKNIALSVRRWPYFKKRTNSDGMEIYKQAVAGLASKLVKNQDADILFISTCQGLAHYKYDDSQVAQEIYDMLPDDVKPHVTVDRNYHHPSDLMDILRHMDMVVATRMHMMIMSLCVGVPVLPIAYEFKTAELAKRFGISEILSDIEDITTGDLIGKAEKLLSNFDEYRRIMLKGVLDEHASAMKAAEYINDLYHGNGQRRYTPSINHHNNTGANDTKSDVSRAA